MKVSTVEVSASRGVANVPDRRVWIGKRVVVYSGPHYGRVHLVTGVSETLAQLYHSSSGDRYSVPFCDLEEVR